MQSGLQSKFQDSQGYKEKLCLKQNKTIKQNKKKEKNGSRHLLVECWIGQRSLLLGWGSGVEQPLFCSLDRADEARGASWQPDARDAHLSLIWEDLPLSPAHDVRWDKACSRRSAAGADVQLHN